jgi:hypothetical protein
MQAVLQKGRINAPTLSPQRICDYQSEQVESFIYLVTKLNAKNNTSEEIKTRIMAANRSYFWFTSSCSNQLGHLLTRSGLTHPEVSSKVFLGSFYLLGCSFLSVWAVCYMAFDLFVSNFSCSPAFCLKLGLYLILSQSLYLFYNLSKCILLFSHIFHLCCCYSSCISFGLQKHLKCRLILRTTKNQLYKT